MIILLILIKKLFNKGNDIKLLYISQKTQYFIILKFLQTINIFGQIKKKK